jgi:hypothetical protein
MTSGIAKSFNRSKSFTLKIQSALSDGSEHGICTVYRCRITSIDNNSVFSLPLCLELFDDRFQPVQSPNEDDEDLLPLWFDPVVIAKTYALNEAFAYDKLRPAQGSVVTWFYGTHRVDRSFFGTLQRFYSLSKIYFAGWNGFIWFALGVHRGMGPEL